MKKIFSLIEKIIPGQDKLKHFYSGYLLAVLSVVVFHLLTLKSPFFIVVPSLLVGVYKEFIHDKKNNGKTELLDIVYTVLPSLVFVIILSIPKTI